MNFTSSRKTVVIEPSQVFIPDTIPVGPTTGKTPIFIDCINGLGNAVDITLFFSSVTGGTVYERNVLSSLISGSSSDYVGLAVQTNLQFFTSSDLVVNLIPGSGIVEYKWVFIQ